MKTIKYLVEIEMPDGDYIGPVWLKNDLQSLFDRDEDAGRIKVVKVTDKYLDEIRGGLAWKDICLIAETIFGMLGKNINDELMGRYDSPKEFYEEVLKKI